MACQAAGCLGGQRGQGSASSARGLHKGCAKPKPSGLNSPDTRRSGARQASPCRRTPAGARSSLVRRGRGASRLERGGAGQARVAREAKLLAKPARAPCSCAPLLRARPDGPPLDRQRQRNRNEVRVAATRQQPVAGTLCTEPAEVSARHCPPKARSLERGARQASTSRRSLPRSARLAAGEQQAQGWLVDLAVQKQHCAPLPTSSSIHAATSSRVARARRRGCVLQWLLLRGETSRQPGKHDGRCRAGHDHRPRRCQLAASCR